LTSGTSDAQRVKDKITQTLKAIATIYSGNQHKVDSKNNSWSDGTNVEGLINTCEGLESFLIPSLRIDELRDMLINGHLLPFEIIRKSVKEITSREYLYGDPYIDFLRKGGGLAVMLHIPPPALNLLRQLHVEVANGTLHEEGAAIDANPLYIKVSRLAEHPVTAGLESFSVYGCWALRGAAEHVEVLAETGPHGWVDLDQNRQFTGADAMQSFGVLVAGQLGQGRYVVFGDDTLFQNRFFDEPNRRLAVNLANWLVRK